jgi:RHS repeat-associated protein
MTYDSAGNLTKATANTGESLTFAYNTYKQVISATDNGGRVWKYQYSGYANLISVTRPFGLNKNYYYRSGITPFLLTATMEGASQYVDSTDYADVFWTYDAASRVTSNYYAGGLKRGDIRYDVDGSRVVTDSLGRETKYGTHLVNGRGFVDSVTGPGFASCGLADAVVEYDASMNVIARTAFGRRTEYGNFDAKGQAGFMIEAAGTADARRTDYAYDARFVGMPVQVSSPSVAAGRLKRVDIGYDARGQVTSYGVSGYRPDGTPVSRTITNQYAGPFGQLTQIDGPRTDVADLTRFDYDPTSKRLLRVTDADGIVTRANLTYTPSGQVATEDRPNGLKLAYAYVAGTNLLQSLTETQGTTSRKTTWDYTTKRQVYRITQTNGVDADLVVDFRYDAAGQLVSVENPGSSYSGPDATGPSVMRFTLDTEGNALSMTKSATQVTQWQDRLFDEYNRLDKLIEVGSVKDYDYHPDGTLSKVTDGRGNATTYTYDAFKRMTRVLRPDGSAQAYAYDAQDHLVRVVDGNDATTTYAIDDLGNRLEVSSPDAGRTTTAYDDAGNPVVRTDAKGQVTRSTYTAGGRLKTVDRPGVADDETYAYDACANGVARTCRIDSGNGEYVAYEYDAFGNVATVKTPNGTLAYAYDAAGNVTAITYPSGRRVTYAHNSAGQVTYVRLVDGLRTFDLAYDIQHLPMGPAASWRYGNGQSEARAYDAAYRPLQLGVPGKFAMTFPEYDGNGNLARRVVDGQAETFGYDVNDRLQAASGGFGLRDYGYDAGGNRRTLTADGVVTQSNYATASNRLLSDTAWTYGRDANGNTTQRADAQGIGTQYSYTASNQLQGVNPIGAPVGQTAVYLFNALGQRTLKSTGSGDRRFVYALDGTLLSESLVDGSVVEEYVYLDGKLLALLGKPTKPATPPAVDQIVDDTAGSFTGTWAAKNSQVGYNGKFRQLTIGAPYQPSDTFTWNYSPPIDGMYDIWVWWVRKPTDGTRTDYLVNGYQVASILHAKQVQGSWAYLGNFPLGAGGTPLQLSEYSNSPTYGSLAGSYLMADAVRFKLVEADTGLEGNYSYAIVDQVGAPQAVMDRAGRLVWRATYDPFGAASVDADPDHDGALFSLNLRLPGQYFDGETGFHYNHMREYDPSTGRYLESDPIGLGGGKNTFAYAEGNPIGRADATGLLAYLCKQGNGYGLGIPIHFVPGDGVSDADIARIVQSIEQFWTGQFGDRAMAVKVALVGPGGKDVVNTVNVYSGQAADVGELNWSNKFWAGEPSFVFAHEAGHLMGLDHVYDNGRNVMYDPSYENPAHPRPVLEKRLWPTNLDKIVDPSNGAIKSCGCG